MTEINPKAEPPVKFLPERLLKFVAVAFFLYLAALTIYAFTNYTTTKAKLLTHGITEATANFAAIAVMLLALALPAVAVFRIAFLRPRPLDFGAALLLPALSWAIAQIPAKFDALTGEGREYCAERPDGTKFCLDRPGVDPLTQRPLIKVDRQSAEDDFRRERDLLPKRITTPVPNIAFFDGITGKPRVWVSKNDSGCFDLYNNPGVNPETGDRLDPVTKETVRLIRRCAPKAQTPASTTAPAHQTASSPPRHADAAQKSLGSAVRSATSAGCSALWREVKLAPKEHFGGLHLGSMPPGRYHIQTIGTVWQTFYTGTPPVLQQRCEADADGRMGYCQDPMGKVLLNRNGDIWPAPAFTPGVSRVHIPGVAYGKLLLVVDGKPRALGADTHIELTAASSALLDVNYYQHRGSYEGSGAFLVTIHSCGGS